MDMTIDQQVALDEALVPHASRLRIGRNVPEIYMHEFWTTATVHRYFIRCKMDNKKHIVEHKDTKKSNEMYYPRFTKVIIHYFMSKDPLISKRNKVNWHYVRDDQMFTTIKLVSRHQNTQQFGAMLSFELANADIRNSEAYKEYYEVATGATPTKTKSSIRFFTFAKGKQPAKASKAKSLTALSKIAMTEAEQLKLATKRSLQQMHISQASGSGTDEGTGTISGVPDVPTEESDEEISKKSSDEGDDDDNVDEGSVDQDDDDAQDDDDDQDDENKDDDDQDEGDDDDDQEEGSDDEQAFDEEGEEFIHPSLSSHDEEETRDEESFDPFVKMPENTDDEGNGEENLGLNVGREEG
nr:hypothetical protein [Tanacetum cinerariifolium]